MKYILREFLLDICEVRILNENKEICCSTGVLLDLYNFSPEGNLFKGKLEDFDGVLSYVRGFVVIGCMPVACTK